MTAPRTTAPDVREPGVRGRVVMERYDAGRLLECRVTFVDDTARVLPRGEVDLASVALVAERLDDVRAAGATYVVLDLGETTFIDSSALHLALTWQERARRERFRFAVVPGSRAVRRTIDAAGLDSVLTLVSEAP
jgi:anti-sigma B factor antagonist